MFSWISDSGTIFPAPAGHAEFARRHLRLQPYATADAARFLEQNQGWIAVERSAPAIRLSWAECVALGAAEKAHTWLETTAQSNHNLAVTCVIDGVEHPGNCHQALERLQVAIQRAGGGRRR